MYVVFGANGHTGNVVAGKLLDSGAKVRLAVRDPAKVEALRARGAEAVKTDVLEPPSVAAALAGVEGAYLLIPPDPSSPDLVGRGRRIVDNFAKALGQSVVRHAVMLSSVGAQHAAGTGPILTVRYAEEILPSAKGVAFTFLRAAYFMENLLTSAQAMKADGALPVFGGGENYPFPMVATRDIGRVAAEAMLAPPREHAWIELSGPREYSLAEAAATASRILSRPVAPRVVPIDAVVPMLMRLGFSENVAGLYREMMEGMGRGLLQFEGKGRTARGTVTLEQVLQAGLS